MGIVKKPLTHQAYKTIKNQIIDLRLRPGELILVQQLSKVLGLSRTPVREALIRLKQEGLVEAAEGRKFKVSEITLDTIIKIYDVRIVLECLAIDKIIDSITKDQIQLLDNILEEMTEAYQNKDFDLFFEKDLQFHNTIVVIYDEKVIKGFLNQLNGKLQRIRYLTRYIEGRVEHTLEEHKKILNYINDKKPEQAKNVLSEHLGNVKQGFEKLYKKSNTSLLNNHFIIIQ